MLRYKKWVILFLILIFYFMCSCSTTESQIILIYKNNEYSPVNHWYMIDEHGTEARAYVGSNTVNRVKENATVLIYQDEQERFIYYQPPISGDILFHKNSDSLPSYSNNDIIDRIECIPCNDVDNPLIIPKDLLNVFTNILLLYENPKAITYKNIKANLGSVYIYYRDYPAYQFIGHIVKTSDGRYAFHRISKVDSTTMNDYIILPEDISKAICDQFLQR